MNIHKISTNKYIYMCKTHSIKSESVHDYNTSTLEVEAEIQNRLPLMSFRTYTNINLFHIFHFLYGSKEDKSHFSQFVNI